MQGAAFKAVVCQRTTSISSACLHQWVPLLALGHSSKRSNLMQKFNIFFNTGHRSQER